MDQKEKGKIWLVGAGPGDPELMTIRGRSVLEQAQVVVYDALVSPQILGMIPEDAKKIYAGKRSGHHFLKQEETNRVLLEEAQKGQRVVRLKGGDPFCSDGEERSWSCFPCTVSLLRSCRGSQVLSRFRPTMVSR